MSARLPGLRPSPAPSLAPSPPVGQEGWTPKACPWCGAIGQVTRCGGFRTASGRRVQRYRCGACCRTFSRNTGTPSYRLHKPSAWQAMIELLAESLPLRRVASRLNISVSTAFRWRHRALTVLSARDRKPLSGDVRVETFLVKYSEKGSRVCHGPGSWGYWNVVRKGEEPVGRVRSGQSAGRRRFRLLIDGRPLHVMVAETDTGYEFDILGQGRRNAEMVAAGLARLIRPGSRVFAFGGSEYRRACETLGCEHHDGVAAVSRWFQCLRGAEEGGASRGAEEVTTPEVRFPNLPIWWLRRFRGVATKYLGHYLAWFRDIVRIVEFPAGANMASADGRALLRRPADWGVPPT